MASLPSLGVSSLDLGRTDLRAAPFIFKPRIGVRLLRWGPFTPTMRA
jgi:hypothetical protein